MSGLDRADVVARNFFFSLEKIDIREIGRKLVQN